MPGQWQASPKDHPCQSSPSDRPRTGIAKGSQHAILLSLDKEQWDFNVPINTSLDSHHPPTSRSKNQNKKKKRERGRKILNWQRVTGERTVRVGVGLGGLRWIWFCITLRKKASWVERAWLHWMTGIWHSNPGAVFAPFLTIHSVPNGRPGASCLYPHWFRPATW